MVATGGTTMNALWLAVFWGVFLWSGIGPKDRVTWMLEVAPSAIGFAVLWGTRARFPLTRLSYGLILIHSVILCIGGHYTYAEVPMFDLLAEWFGWGRNNYDKVGHLAQGFVPALLAREVFLRNGVVNGRGWLRFQVVCFALALSAVYELIEWGAALLSAEAAESFLGTQGYVWDTQSDMALAGLGAVLALALLGREHDRQLAALGGPADSSPATA